MKGGWWMFRRVLEVVAVFALLGGLLLGAWWALNR